MSDFQIIIHSADNIEQAAPSASEQDPYAVETHGRGTKQVVKKIDELSDVWQDVIEKLTKIADTTESTAENAKYKLSSIQFNLGIEGGLNIGLVTKGSASISITFSNAP